ncbi:MAG TPA: DNA recombination protein RmuC, partial [Devosia sp.]|nr:DNA recombination protein RmuC [Devosia sp.]
IGQLTQNSLRMSKEATDLTRALKGNAQTQGAWGEMILDSILAGSGLEEGKQYFVQQSHETGSGRVRTDVEVLFPNGDRMVVDSKVSLVAYEGFCNCDNEDQRTAFLRQHLDSMRGHIKALAAKDYHVHAGRGPEFVMMFIPIEAAFATAFSEDASLIEYAMKRNVYLTTPTTLMVALRTVRNVWDIEARNRNAEDIANRAGELYNKVAGFLTNMDKLDRSLEAARKSYDEARGQLVSGRGSVVRQVEMLQKLGARNSKDIPQSWKDMAESSISEAGSPEKDAPAESRVAEKAGPEGERLPKFLGTNRATPSRNKG